MDVTEHHNYEDIDANRGLIDALHAQGYLSAEARNTALDILHPRDHWLQWIIRLLSGCGAALILSGIIYFFAFNWQAIPPLAKLFGLEALMATMVIIAAWRGLNSLIGQLSLTSGFVLMGVFMAVYGQIYQTGADAWQLFFNWALLGFVWVAISRNVATWAIWMLVANLAIMLWWVQAANARGSEDVYICLLMSSFNGFALILREYGLRQGLSWLGASWPRVLLLWSVVGFLVPPAIIWIFDRNVSTAVSITALISILVHIGLFYLYRFRMPDMWGLSSVALSLCIMVEAAMLRMLDKVLNDVFGFFFVSVMSIVLFGVVINYLRKVAEQIAEAKQEASYEG